MGMFVSLCEPKMWVPNGVDGTKSNMGPLGDQMSTFCPGCGRRLLNDWCSWCAEHIREPQIGRFEVKAVLGSGQLGTLLLARDPHLSRNVAIRTVGSGVPNADWVDQYIAVVRQTARLPHPNCVDIYSVLTNLHEPAVVMEYVQGGTLEAVWRAARAATSPVSVQALQQILGVLRGLAFLHENGLVHGRVRAQNVLTPTPETAKLTDAGLGMDPESETARWFGAPEVLLGDGPSPAADVYSAGVLLWRLASGSYPFEAPNRTAGVVLRQRPPAGSPDPRFGEVLSSALQFDAALRPSAAEMARVLASTLQRDR
jgi:serine/threonine protein kinase